MAPSVTEGSVPSRVPAANGEGAHVSTQETRTLLLAPPSLSSHPEILAQTVEAHDRSSTDLQMLDRLALGLASLPASTYDLILLLTGTDEARQESQGLLDRDVMSKVFSALRPTGRLKSLDQEFGKSETEKTEAILAGLLYEEESGAFMKPAYNGSEAVPITLGRRSNGGSKADAGAESVALNGKRKAGEEATPTVPSGVGFVDFSDDFEAQLVTGEDDELIDEDSLLTEEDLTRPVVQPPECRPKAGKRRRACKDCTCGLKQKIEAEDAAKRSTADKALGALKLEADDLNEIDFTVQGKVGSCGNCALGDAFRCDGCPYIGLPAFKPGEEVRLLNNDVQL